MLIALRILIITYGSVKHPDAGKDARQEEKGATEDEMVGWHYYVSRLWEIVKYTEIWCAAVHGVTKSQTQLSK